MSSNAIVLAIRPQYVEKIVDGSKKVELRRIRPKQTQKGDLVFIYVSSPIQALAGAFKVDEIIEKPLSELWNLVKDKAGISEEEFNNYYLGTETGVAIFFNDVWLLNEPLKVQNLQEQGINFQPPQGFRYATLSELASPFFSGLVGNSGMPIQNILPEHEPIRA